MLGHVLVSFSSTGSGWRFASRIGRTSKDMQCGKKNAKQTCAFGIRSSGFRDVNSRVCFLLALPLRSCLVAGILFVWCLGFGNLSAFFAFPKPFLSLLSPLSQVLWRWSGPQLHACINMHDHAFPRVATHHALPRIMHDHTSCITTHHAWPHITWPCMHDMTMHDHAWDEHTWTFTWSSVTLWFRGSTSGGLRQVPSHCHEFVFEFC